MTAISILLQRAADADNHTGPERAAALNGASRLAAEQGITITTWPDPPSGYQWQGQPGAGGRLVRTDVPWWRGGPESHAKPVPAVAPAAPERKPAKLTPRLERFVELIARPGGATLEDLGGTVGSIKATVSQARQCGYAIAFDRVGQRYHMASTPKGIPLGAYPADMVAVGS